MPSPSWMESARFFPRSGRSISPTAAPGLALAKPGQITSDFRKTCQAPKRKIFRFIRNPNQDYIHFHPVPTRGALAIVTNVGRGCGGRESCDRRARLKRTAKTCGPDVAVLASMHLEATASQGATEAKEPFSGEITL